MALGVQMKLWTVVWEPLVDMAEIRPHLPEHIAYLSRLAEDGRLLGSGPQLDGDDEMPEGRGLTLLVAPDSERARALAEADPLAQLGLRRFTLSRWRINEGQLADLVAEDPKASHLSPTAAHGRAAFAPPVAAIAGASAAAPGSDP